MPELHASSFALDDARPVSAMMQQRGVLLIRSCSRMARVALIPSKTGMDISMQPLVSHKICRLMGK